MAASAPSKLVIIREALCVFDDLDLVLKCFCSLLLPVLEYCSPVWISSAVSDLYSRAMRFSNGLVVCVTRSTVVLSLHYAYFIRFVVTLI